MKSRLKLFGLLTLLMLLITSCEDDDFTPIIPEEQEVPSAKDNLPWPLTQYMDAVNYRPGDDFYLYCNGKYWENAPMGDKKVLSDLYETEMPEALEELKAWCLNPVYDQVESHESVEVSNDQLYAFMKPFYEKIDCIQSYEDAFRVAGELMMEGLYSLIGIDLIFEDKVLLYIAARESYVKKSELKTFMGTPIPMMCIIIMSSMIMNMVLMLNIGRSIKRTMMNIRHAPMRW